MQDVVQVHLVSVDELWVGGSAELARVLAAIVIIDGCWGVIGLTLTQQVSKIIIGNLVNCIWWATTSPIKNISSFGRLSIDIFG